LHQCSWQVSLKIQDKKTGQEFGYKDNLQDTSRHMSPLCLMNRAVRKSRIHDRRDFRRVPLPWFRVTAVNIGKLYAISVFKRSLLSKFCSTFPFLSCTGYAHGHLTNFAYLLSLQFWDVFLSYFIKFRILMLERGGVSCSHYFSCFTFMVETII